MGLDIGGFVGDVTGGILGTSSAERAAPQLAQISEETKGEILGELGASWKDIKGYLQPYLQQGKQALRQYKQQLGVAPDAPVFEGFEFDPSKLEENPAYQFVRQQGLQAVNRQAAANRALTSGNRMTALADYASGLASQEYGNEFQRQLQQYQTGEQAKARTFDVQNLLQRQKMGDIGNLVNLGSQTATNLGSFRQNLSQQRAGVRSNYAAEQAGAMLLPAQEKQSFIQNLIGGGAQAAGAYYGAR